jgi:adenylylsulfate kinase
MSECNENHGRSIAKAISYRILSITVDTAIIYFLTRKIELTLSIVLVTNISSTFLYYLHERGWNKLHFKRGLLKKMVLKPRKSRRKTT